MPTSGAKSVLHAVDGSSAKALRSALMAGLLDPPRGAVANRALRGCLRRIAILVFAAGAAPAVADPIAYVVGPLSNEADGLSQIDLANGEVTEIGPYLLDLQITSLAFAPSGTLYGLGNDSAGGVHLVTLDPATGSATQVVELMLEDQPGSFEAMTADACGRLWAQGFLEHADGDFREAILGIDPTSGAVEEILTNPIPAGPRGLAARGEVLWTVHQGVLATLDPSTGEITPIGGSSVPPVDYDFAADGGLWGVRRQLPTPPIPVPVPEGATFRVDPVTGDFEVVAANNRFFLGGGAIGPPPGTCGAALPIPTASAAGLAVLAVVVAATGTVLLGRRSTRAGRAR